MNKAIGIIAAILLSSLPSALAESETIPIDETFALEKTTLTLHIPEDNKLQWAFVEGKISNPAADYPVIIQIYQDNYPVDGNNVGAVHFAQTAVNADGTYEYKFRVADTLNGELVNLFHGDYTVKIFKVVYTNLSTA